MSGYKVPSKANIRVYWNDTADNYSVSDKNKVKQYFSDKYSVPKNSISIVFRPIKKDKEGNKVELIGSGIDNIMDINYQRHLFKEWLKNEKINVDINRLIALDDKVNNAINFNFEEYSHRTWSLLSLEINNLLCFGDNNTVNFSELTGINTVESSPQNMGGKTTFIIDSLSFLFFGTTTKSDKNEDLFNKYRDCDALKVKGSIMISDTIYSIERIMKRSLKKDGSYAIKNTVNFYEKSPNSNEILLDGEDAKKTTKFIMDTVGSEDDFRTIIMADADNLEDLIDSLPTARGKLLTRFIGLEIIEKKESVAKDMYTAFSKSMKSNQYNLNTLTDEISEHKNNIKEIDKALIESNIKLENIKSELIKLNSDKDNALLRKQYIDEDIISLDKNRLISDIDSITKKGIEYSGKLKEYNKSIEDFGILTLDENLYESKLKEERHISLNIERYNSELRSILKLNEELKNGGICPTCKQKLKDVDHSEHILTNDIKINEIKSNIDSETVLYKTVSDELSGMKKVNQLINEKNKLELSRDRLEVELNNLRADLKLKNADIKKYELNNTIIELNRTLDIEITGIQCQIQLLNGDKDITSNKISKLNNDREQNKLNIENKNKIIDIINKESEVEFIYKTYINMVGKKGISKMVLKTAIPMINFELYSLLDDVVDFTLELEINSKNEVDFIMERDGVRKMLKSGSGFECTISAIALRCVLARISNLPKPNFIGFDEVFGKIANENLDYAKLLFDKIKNIFDIVLIITHNNIIKDWSDNIVTIKKVDNVSSIHVK